MHRCRRALIGEVGYVRVHNSLGDSALVPAFDHALDALTGVRALVIDLRDTPSGGVSSVARGLIGRLITQPLPYQQHELVSEFRANGIRRVWQEWVLPRGTAFAQPVVVLVGHWTGSMGEGLAIGLHGTRQAPVLGEPMARLRGALTETALPHSKIVVRVPNERLSLVDGTPREAFVPCAVPASNAATGDRELDAAIGVAQRLAAQPAGAAPAGRSCPPM